MARATREPFLNVHFCGTESATEWNGYMDGAIQSGERVMNEVLYKLYENEKKHQVRVDFEKTYYYQEKYIKNLIEQDLSGKNNSITSRIVSYSKRFCKFAFGLGVSYILLNRMMRHTNLFLNSSKIKFSF